MFKDFKPEIKLFLIVAFIAVAISIGGILLLKGTQTPPPSPQPQAIDTSDWQTYRNEEFGFEFQYPKVFDEYSGCELRDILGDQTLTLGSSISIFSDNTEGLSLEEYVTRNFFSEYQFDISRRDIQVGEKDAIQIGSRTAGLGRYSEITYVLDKDKVYTFTYQARPNCLPYEISTESELSVLQQILSTFRFVESEEVNAEKSACEEAGGAYVGCPANPGPNAGLCTPCECPAGFMWSFVPQTCARSQSL